MDGLYQVDMERMRHLACIATAVMEPVSIKNERLSPTSPADVTPATFPRIEPPPATQSSFNMSFQPHDAAAAPALPSLLLRHHHQQHTPLHEKQAQHLLWKAQEQELMRRQRQIIALKEKQQAIRRRAAAAVAASAANRHQFSLSGPSRKGAPQHHLQELFMQQRREEQEREDAMRRNLVHLNYHRMLAEEDLERLRHQEESHASMQHAYLVEQKSTVFDAAVVHASSSSTSSVMRRPMSSPRASMPPPPPSSPHPNLVRPKRSTTTSPSSTSLDASQLILQFMLPPVVPHRTGLNIKDVSLNELRPHFNKPMAAVAKELGVCITLMKKICRKNGLCRWPHRRIRSLVNRITSLQVVAESVDSTSERSRFHVHIANLRKELSDVIQNPNGKSRKARGYDRKKADHSDDDNDDNDGDNDRSSSSSSTPSSPSSVTIPRKEEQDLSCLEELEGGPGTTVISTATRRTVPFHGRGGGGLPSLFQAAAREA
ncbi:hypothetical protein DYB25_004116 [Aphanomyces astaci]|uniref:RWP-RK domain-containing protein n=1 Tax=Aphanomyces astaci TaxID=112090 RepID=A0A397C1K0_APHAT|nr:hypothetical protein DYB25_004116 [Aphanomyces astaci]